VSYFKLRLGLGQKELTQQFLQGSLVGMSHPKCVGVSRIHHS
jgi:hypothetical protein